MVVTSSTFWMVKVPLYQVVRMIAMRNCLMPTSWAVLVASDMTPALVVLAWRGIFSANRDRMLIDVICVGVV